MENSIQRTIYDLYNIPLSNVKVQAYDKDLRTEQFFGVAIFSWRGFEIRAGVNNSILKIKRNAEHPFPPH